MGANRRISSMLVSEMVHDGDRSLLDNLTLHQLERISINFEAQKLHKAQNSWQLRKVVVFQVKIVHGGFQEYLIGHVRYLVVTDIQDLQTWKPLLTPEDLDIV
jgi:hypothetical protein